MFGRGKLLVAGIFFTAFCCKVSVGIKLLDDASNVIDYLYTGCSEEAMKKFIHSGLLNQELNKSEGFHKAWKKNAQCKSLIPGGIHEHTSALSALIDGDVDFLEKFNDAVETLGVNLTTYETDFHFKSLHFLLMDSMQLLKPKTSKTLYTDYNGKETPKIGSTVRFPAFTVVEPSTKFLGDLIDLTVLKIESSFFVNLGDHTCKNTDSVLISPAEVFTVMDVVEKTSEDDDEYTEVVLKHAALNDTHNCFMFLRSTSTRLSGSLGLLPLVPLLVVLSLWSCV